MKGLTRVHIVLVAALSLLMLLSLLMATYEGAVSISAQFDFDAYRGAPIPDASIDGTIGPEWDYAGYYPKKLIDPEIDTGTGRFAEAEIWTKHDGTYLYIAIRFTIDSSIENFDVGPYRPYNPWLAISFESNACVTGDYPADGAVFGDDRLRADGYADVYFENFFTVPGDVFHGGSQDGVGAWNLTEITFGEEYLVTVELKKPLDSGDTVVLDTGETIPADIAWSVGGTYSLYIAWDSDGVGTLGGGSSGGTTNHLNSVLIKRRIYIDPNPISLSVMVTVNPSAVNSSGTSTITVQVTDGINPVSEAYVTLSSDKGGSFSPSSGNSDPNGYFSSTFTAPNVLNITKLKITATASKSGYVDGSGHEDLWVLPPDILPLLVTVAANPSTVNSGESSTITVNVTDGVNPIPDATVTLSSDNGGTFSQESGNTDPNGVFASNFTAPSVTQQTTITITANVTKEGYFGVPSQTEVTVEPSKEEGGIELVWILIAVAVISIVVITAVLIVRRGRREKVYERMRKDYEKAARGL